MTPKPFWVTDPPRATGWYWAIPQPNADEPHPVPTIIRTRLRDLHDVPRDAEPADLDWWEFYHQPDQAWITLAYAEDYYAAWCHIPVPSPPSMPYDLSNLPSSMQTNLLDTTTTHKSEE